jgi:hypothetical protein
MDIEDEETVEGERGAETEVTERTEQAFKHGDEMKRLADPAW